jgi:hypothetical protein
MAMTPDELSAPLGVDRGPKAQHPFRSSVHWAAIATLGLLALGLLAWAMVAHDPLGGKPIAPARTAGAAPDKTSEHAGPLVLEAGGNDARDPRANPSIALLPSLAPPATRTVTIIDGTSGKRQEVVLPATLSIGSVETQPTENPRRGPVAKPAPRAGAKDGIGGDVGGQGVENHR